MSTPRESERQLDRRQLLGTSLGLAAGATWLHGCAPEEVHFHEVGAVDSLVDAAGAGLAVARLEGLHGDPFLGRGFVEGNPRVCGLCGQRQLSRGQVCGGRLEVSIGGADPGAQSAPESSFPAGVEAEAEVDP